MTKDKTKNTRNKMRDTIGDYYKTNRQISEEYRKSEKKGDGETKGREKAMIIMLVVLLIVLSVKSLYLDEVKDLNPQEQQFKDFVEYSVSQEQDGFLEKRGLMVYRVYDLYMADEKQNGVLKYVDPNTNEEVQITQKGRYNARVRGYLLWIFPAKHFSVTAKYE